MPKVNIYLPDELAETVKEAGIPVSAVCQQALEQMVRRVTKARETVRMDLDPDNPPPQPAHLTGRAHNAIQLGIQRARRDGVAEVGTEHLLAGLLEEGANMALRVLQSLEIEPAQLRDELTSQAPRSGTSGGDTTMRYDPAAAKALDLALSEALGMGHNYVGCEHILLGLLAEQDGAAGQLLRSRGAEPRLARRAVSAALAGFMHAQSRESAQNREGAQGREGAPANPAALLAQALDPINARLDRLEAGLRALAARQPGG